MDQCLGHLILLQVLASSSGMFACTYLISSLPDEINILVTNFKRSFYSVIACGNTMSVSHYQTEDSNN